MQPDCVWQNRVANTLAMLCVILVGQAADPCQRVRAEQPPTVSADLELWLDAGRINEQRKSTGEIPLASGDSLDRWHDGSERTRDMVQTDRGQQPKLMRLGESWFVRFDGEDDCLRYQSDPVDFTAATIWMVAAPHRNPGEFRGLFAANEAGRRDYESGFNLDLGPGPTLRFDQLNVEGRGFGGANDLRTGECEFGTLRLIELRIDPEERLVSLWIDGQPEGTRPLTPGPLSFQQLTLGARFYTNGPGEQVVRGNSAVDIAEVLVYSGAISEEESKSIRDYLLTRHAVLAEAIPKSLPRDVRGGIPLVKAENPPAIQMLIPGFRVSEIPVELTNVNSIRFREDGKLVALGYNGDVHLLSDANGDGLEDHAEVFYKNQGSLRGPIGIALTPPGYAKGRGLFVPSKGKVSLIVDTDGDDRADDEILVADGWNEIPQNVDAVGIAMDADGNLYFGLGTANYANGYLINDQGVAEYSLLSDRGTVQKVSADFSRRETVCTGIRFPIAFAFNDQGDLFCTEQEGATWLANGNPFDELLHIREGRHYGFPPRHPRHNPNVIDEPSTFDYGPQHQSTCGMVFNGPVLGGNHFGPAWWKNQAIVCGESRGKLWRTQLVKTEVGYVADSQLIACLQLLTVDACVAPNGDLVVACHSGPPDWGTGPTGIGKLFRIHMTEPDVPRPVAAWAESSREVRIAFDHPLDPLTLRDLTRQVRIEFGEFVRPGDRFENLAPPYAVVQRQQLAPRWELPVIGVSVSQDLRTLIISTEAMTELADYAITMPDLAADSNDGSASSHRQIDLGFSPRGVWVAWNPADGSSLSPWSGWIPHLDLSVARQLLAESAMHQSLWNRLDEPGQLTLTTQVDLRDVLRPAVQPGSQLDYQWPDEIARLTLTSTGRMSVNVQAGRGVEVESSGEGTIQTLFSPANVIDPIEIAVTLTTGTQTAGTQTAGKLRCSVATNEDATARPMPLRRFLVPWLDARREVAPDANQLEIRIAELEGGSWGRGHRLFHSEQVGCFKCHLANEQGHSIGPDLRNLVHRDYASVMRDIVDPSFAINPDYIGHLVALDDGRVLTGVLRTEGGQLILGNDQGISERLEADRIERMQPASVSVMPKGLFDKLDESQRRDLMTYLLSSPPQMPLDAPLEAPPIRTAAEVATALSGTVESLEPLRPLNLVLVDGVKDHGPGEHDYPAWQRVWEQLFLADPTLTVSTARDFPDDAQLASADVVIFFQKGSFSGIRPAKLDAYLKRGGGAVYIHWAVNGDDRSADFARRIGLASHGGNIKYRHGPLTLDLHNLDHPIVRNFDRLQLYDESYWKLSGDPGQVTLLATSMEDGEPTPQMWVTDQHGGRVFVSIPGHYSWTFDDPLFRILLLRGIAWTASQPVDRFNSLVTPGARMSR